MFYSSQQHQQPHSVYNHSAHGFIPPGPPPHYTPRQQPHSPNSLYSPQYHNDSQHYQPQFTTTQSNYELQHHTQSGTRDGFGSHPTYEVRQSFNQLSPNFNKSPVPFLSTSPTTESPQPIGNQTLLNDSPQSEGKDDNQTNGDKDKPTELTGKGTLAMLSIQFYIKMIP